MRSILVPLAALFLFLLPGKLSAQFSASIVAGGETEVCLGNSVKAYIWFSGGLEPYDVVINNRDGEFMVLEDIGSPYTVFLEPESNDSFYIASAIDRRGDKGTTNGSVEVTVLSATPVSFDLDRSTFLMTEPGYVLTSFPTGGSFIGPGVANGRFYPEIASYEDSPHTITCTFTNSSGCESTTQTDLFVLGGEASVYLLSGDDSISSICDKSISYTLKGNNLDDLPGSFELFADDVAGLDPVHGHITDTASADNEAILDPEGLAGSYEVHYTYGVNELEISATLSLEINELGTVVISGLPGTVCESDEPYLLVPETDIEDPTPIYTFSGPGVVGSQDEGFYFDPGSADAVEGKHDIELDYTSSFGCSTSSQQTVTVKFAPELSFTLSPVCLPASGGLVSFDNTSSGKYAVDSWSWDFGDPESGENNSSDQEHPGHFYQEPGTRTISLTATTDNGCVAVLQMDTVLADQPEANFILVNDCYIKGVKTAFLDRSVSAFADINQLTWTFKTKSGGTLGIQVSESPADTIAYDFRSLDQYQVNLQVVNESGCQGEVNRAIDLKPIRNLKYSSYHEDFNGNATAWEVYSENNSYSWKRNEPDFTGFTPGEGDLAWYTELPEQVEGYLEHSWVQSPCFGLSGLSTPLVQLDLMKSFVPGMDGAVLQYQEMASDAWTTIGTLRDGVNWYNHADIGNRPGGSSSGWGLELFEPDTEWISASHSLVTLTGKPFVKLRIAIGTGGKQDIGNQGFAFDNFFIGQRIRRSVLEYFTNASSAAAGDADKVVESYVNENPGIVYDLQYHMDYPGVDPMNANNPHPPSTRAWSNGVSTVPYAILNGGIEPDLRYDFSDSSQEPDSKTLIEASLENPLFNMKLMVTYLEDRLEGAVQVSCAADTFTNNLQLYLVVIERELTAYSGLNSDTFRNVVLDMLPNAGGKLLGNQWSRGSTDTVEFSWIYASHVEDVEDLSVVAFVQDRDQGYVLQAEAIPHTPGLGLSPLNGEAGLMHVYPNPARDFLYINYGERTKMAGEIKLMDLSGRVLKQSEIVPGTKIQQLDISQLPDGMYMIYRMESGVVKAHSKFVRIR